MRTVRLFVALLCELPEFVAGRLDAFANRVNRRGAP